LTDGLVALGWSLDNIKLGVATYEYALDPTCCEHDSFDVFCFIHHSSEHQAAS